MLIYISLGLLGLPVFADGGGLSYILRPAFGYIIGLAASAFVTGALSRKQKNASFSILAAAGFAGMLTVYVIGITYFWLISSYYLKTTPELRILFINCFLMTLPGDVIMILLSSVMAKRLIPLVLKAECS